jgi:hypothetical protein
MAEQKQVTAPEPVEPRREEYRPQIRYTSDDVEVNAAVDCLIYVTAEWVARHADYYHARSHSKLRTEKREGPLPTEPDARAAFVHELLNWLQTIQPLWATELMLKQGDVWLLDFIDSVPGILYLTPDEFATLQEEWATHGIPTDAYYPISAMRGAVDPLEMHGGIVLGYLQYSPRAWQARDLVALKQLRQRIPSEAERLVQFAEACTVFIEAVSRRLAELAEPGRERDEEELAKLHALLTQAIITKVHTLRKAKEAASPAKPDLEASPDWQ